jgi:murein DD-endopeptidase MepM/ murein hydrolase activator NlpD
MLTGRKRPRLTPDMFGAGWVWPVPSMLLADNKPPPITLVAYPAVVTQEFRDPSHLGLDIAYRRRFAGDRPEYADPHSSTGPFFAPATTPILAAHDGVVWSVDRSPRGIEVVIDHGKPFATYYQHLASTTLAPHARGKQADGRAGTRVRAGDVIGAMGHDPIDPQGFRHLHFAVWYQGGGNDASADPAEAMRAWSRKPWTRT